MFANVQMEVTPHFVAFSSEQEQIIDFLLFGSFSFLNLYKTWVWFW